MPELYRLADLTHVNTQAEARHSGQPWEKVDVPTKRHELLEYLNDIASKLRGGSPQEAPPAVEEVVETPELEPDPAPKLAPPPPTPTPPSQLELRVDHFDAMDADALAPIIETAVERLGELGEDGFEALEQHQARTGVGGSFSRGVHILSVTASGPHQLTRMLFKARKKDSIFTR